MQNFSSTDFAVSIADHMVADRFGKIYGIHSFAEYLDLVDRVRPLILTTTWPGESVKQQGRNGVGHGSRSRMARP